MRVLGIESSCDETAASVVGPAAAPGGPTTAVLSDVVHTQAIHQEYLGVVPELASRAHAEKIVAVTRAALDRAGLERPDAVAATAGPGLIGAVLVGLSFGKALSAGWGVPFAGVNHLEGHLLSPLLEDPPPAFPFLALVVSGGHTTLYLARALGDYEVLSTTVDDAAGEAYDKVARLLGLGYPGGPVVDRLAAGGDPAAVAFPRPRAKGLNMSFSGLKTAVANHVRGPAPASPEDVAASFQAAVVDVLTDRVLRAARATGVRRLALSGGVAANSALRARMTSLPDIEATLPPRSRCTDNAAMIAHAGRLRLLAGQRDPLSLRARPSWQAGRLWSSFQTGALAARGPTPAAAQRPAPHLSGTMTRALMSGPEEHPATILRALEQRARRRFGQNFLARPDIPRRIAALTGAGPGDRVLEVGPGLGALSRSLLERGAAVTAVELDRDLADYLEEALPALTLVRGDALRVDFASLMDPPPEGGSWIAASNLPYNVATPVLMRLLELGPRLRRLVLMFQKEVAMRLVAAPGSRTFGALSLRVQARARARVAMTLPPGAFHPRPKVDSAVVVLTPRPEPLTGEAGPAGFDRAVRAGFSQRRKRLENALKATYGKARAREVVAACGFAGRRAESLDLAAWARLADALERPPEAPGG